MDPKLRVCCCNLAEGLTFASESQARATPFRCVRCGGSEYELAGTSIAPPVGIFCSSVEVMSVSPNTEGIQQIYKVPGRLDDVLIVIDRTEARMRNASGPIDSVKPQPTSAATITREGQSVWCTWTDGDETLTWKLAAVDEDTYSALRMAFGNP